MEFLTNPENWIAILSLSAMLITLDLDNVVFISVLSGKLQVSERENARRLGLLMGIGIRIVLLLVINYIMEHLKSELFTVFGKSINGKSLIMLAGGLFLLTKATLEIHHRTEGQEHEENLNVKSSFSSVIGQIFVLDLIFSIDSIVTAVGMTNSSMVMIISVLISMFVMYIFAKGIGAFIGKHPTMKMLALAFLLLIGVLLLAEGLHMEFSKSYIYFAMSFSLLVEFLNIRAKKNNPHLFEPHKEKH